MMKMGTSLNIRLARIGVRTKIVCDAITPGEAVARSVLIGTANKAKGCTLPIGDGAIRHLAYGFVDRDVTMTGGSSL
jgi:hypothetical protein